MGDRAPVDGEDHVARLEAGPGGRAALFDGADEGAAGFAEAEAVGERLVDGLDGDAEPAALHLAGGHELALDVHRDVDRDREREALVAAAAGIDLRVDADHLAGHVEERAARVAGIHGDVGLDEGHVAAVRQVAALAETMPAVALFSKPKGAPMASTHSPTRVLPGLPIFTVGSPLASIFSTATSVALSMPITLARNRGGR